MKLFKLTKPRSPVAFARILTLILLVLAMQASTALAQKKEVKKALKATADGSTALSITPNGNVGIGTPNPQAKLDVQGDVKINGNNINLTNPTGGRVDFFSNGVFLNNRKLFFRGGADTNAFIQWGMGDNNTVGKDSDVPDANQPFDKMAIVGNHGVKIGSLSDGIDGEFLPIIRVGNKGQNAVIDMMAESRKDNLSLHPQQLAMYVTGNLNYGSLDNPYHLRGIQFRGTDAKQGIGFLKDAIYGALDGQNLNFKVFGDGNLIFSAREQRMFIRNNGTVGIMKDFFVGENETNPRFKVDNNGFVGIGTPNPQAPLVVNKKNSTNNDNYVAAGWGYKIDRESGVGKAPANGAWRDCSIYAIGDIVTPTSLVGAENSSFSDSRLKKDLKISSSTQDLETLRKVQITDYKMIDTIQNNRSYKKVIAQQVQKVYPVAVGTSFRTLPDVFQQALTVTKQADSLYTITLSKPAKLKAGDLLELKCAEAGDAKVTVLKLLSDKSFTVHSTTDLAKQSGLFVYGHPATDVLTVDYEAISMLNVSATQQLANTIDAQQKQIDQLTKQNAELARAMQAMALTMARLQKAEDVKPQTTAQVEASANK